jgi:hypothetical protein
MISGWVGCGRKWSWPNLNYYPSIALKILRKTTKNFSLGQNLNHRPPEYKAKLLTTQP